MRKLVEEDAPRILGGFGRVCRIHGRKVYRALGAGDRRRRRITSSEVLMRRLLSPATVISERTP